MTSAVFLFMFPLSEIKGEVLWQRDRRFGAVIRKVSGKVERGALYLLTSPPANSKRMIS